METRAARCVVFAALSVCASIAAAAPVGPLFDLRGTPHRMDNLDVDAVPATSPATGASTGEIALAPTGDHTARVIYGAPDGSLDLAGQSLVAHVRNVGNAPATVRLRIENDGASNLTDACTMSAVLAPGESKDIRARAIARPVDPTYAPFAPFMMYYKNLAVRDNTVDPTKIARVVVEIDRPQQGTNVVLSSITVEGAHDDHYAPPPFLPFIDKYGQYVHSEWPGKVANDADLDAQRDAETRERAAFAGPTNWDKWGGWADGPKVDASGYFRVQKVDGKWWFVDPDGRLFWSSGPTGVGFGGDVTPVTDRADWFTELPARDGPWASFYRDGRGATYKYYSDRAWTGLDIARLNLVRKYGPDYQKLVADISHERLRSWGFNTIGNWSDREVYSLDRTPYVVALGSPNVSVMKWTDGHSIADVYDPAWERGLTDSIARQAGRTAGDPWCIGYFVDNERCIGWRPRGAALGEIALKAPATQPAKLKLIELLKTKYATIDKLNDAWKTTYASWDALRDSRDAPTLKDRDKEPIIADLGDFGMAFAERYFSLSHDAVKKAAPHQLFLGSRLYGHTDNAVVELATKYWDVISYNIYDNPPDGRINQYAKLDYPILSSEWGVGSDPTQTPFRGDDMHIDPQQRARDITQYMQHALHLPNCVGAHFFQFRDQPISGRPDGEATLRGYVNIVDTPNFELVQTNRRIGYHLYEIRAGK